MIVVAFGPTLQAQELGQAQVGGAAVGLATGVETNPAVHRQRGGENVGGFGQIAVRVAADQLPVFGRHRVALDPACPLADRRQVAFAGVFGEEERRAPMADGQRRARILGGSFGTGGQPLMERAGRQLVEQVERPRPQLSGLRQRQTRQQRQEPACFHTSLYKNEGPRPLDLKKRR